MSEPDGRLGGKTERSIRDTRLADCTLSELWPISMTLHGPLIDRLAGIVQDRRASPTNLTPAVKTIRAVTWLKSLREGEVCKPEVPGAIKTGILAMPVRIA